MCNFPSALALLREFAVFILRPLPREGVVMSFCVIFLVQSIGVDGGMTA